MAERLEEPIKPVVSWSLISRSRWCVAYTAREPRFRYEKDMIMGVRVSPADRRRRQRGAARAAGLSAMVVAFIALVALATPMASGATGAASTRPNIVFILTDDLSWNLITPRIAPHIVQLERLGETFTNYYVADSLCCPSRATIFTGLFPPRHQGDDERTTIRWIHEVPFTRPLKQDVRRCRPKGGIQNVPLGQIPQRYGDKGGGVLVPPGRSDNMTKANAPIPPGWNDWHVSNNTGYQELNYYLNDNGHFHFYPFGFGTYGVDVSNRYDRRSSRRMPITRRLRSRWRRSLTFPVYARPSERQRFSRNARTP